LKYNVKKKKKEKREEEEEEEEEGCGLSLRSNYTDQETTKLIPTFVDRGSHVVSVTFPYSCILDFLDQTRYFLFQVAPQLYS
jgi:hypothetical protein